MQSKMQSSKEWLQVSPYKQIPSSCIVHVTGCKSPILVLANGSPYLYCVDTREGKLLASVRFSCDVRHVANTGDLVTCVVCCLDNGQVVATSLEGVCSKSHKHSQRQDIFKSLLLADSAHSSRHHDCIQGEQISVTIATSSISNLTLHQVRIIRNKLVMTCSANGEQTLRVYLSLKKTVCGSHTVPVFQREPLNIYSLSTSPPGAHGVAYRPSLYVVGCDEPSNQIESFYDASLCPDLYSQLFGPDITLSESPVVLVGCQNGHILYSPLSQLSQGHSHNKPRPLTFMCSLGQPVTSIHALHFPARKIESITAPSIRLAPNALVMFGRLGKLVVCTVGQQAPSLFESHIAGPVVSSLLVKDHTLLYTSLSEMYGVCLKESCVRDQNKSTKDLIVIPKLRLQLPDRIAQIHHTSVILDILHVDHSVTDTMFEIACMSLDGRVCSHKIKACSEGRRNEMVLAEELKHCLRSLQLTSSCLSHLSERKEDETKTLKELGEVIEVIRDVVKPSNLDEECSQSDYSRGKLFPFQFVPTFEAVGVTAHRACVDVHFTNRGSALISQGWSLIIQSHNQPNRACSQVVPLYKLLTGGEVVTRVYVEPGLCNTLNCSLHYDASHLLTRKWVELNKTTPTSVTLPMCERKFDAFDFLLSSEVFPKQLFSTRHNSTSRTGSCDLELSETMSVPMATATKVIGSRHFDTNATNSSQLFLCALLRKQELIKLISESNKETSEARLTSYNGSVVRIVTRTLSDNLILSVHTTSVVVLMELIKCVRNRLDIE